MNKQVVLKNKILLILIGLTGGIGNIVIPNLSIIANAYPDVSESVLMMITTMPYLTSIPTSLFCVLFCRKLGNKKTVLLSMLLLGIGGALPIVFSDFTFVLFGRAILGFGWGIVMTIPYSLVSVFIPVAEQANFIGVATAVISLGSAAFQFLAGFLGANIKLMWGSHLVALLFLAILLFLFPKDQKDVAQVSEEVQDTTGKKEKVKLPAVFFIVLLLNMLVTGCLMCGQNNVSFLVESRGLGTSQMAGTILSVYSVLCFVGGLITGAVVKILKKNTMLICSVAAGAGHAIFGFAPNALVLWLGVVLMGLPLGIISALIFIHNSWLVPEKYIDVAASILTGMNLAACFFMIYVPTYISQFLGYGDSYPALYVIVAILFVIIGILNAVVFKTKEVKKSIDQYFAES